MPLCERCPDSLRSQQFCFGLLGCAMCANSGRMVAIEGIYEHEQALLSLLLFVRRYIKTH